MFIVRLTLSLALAYTVSLQTLSAQLTITVSSVPAETPPEATLYVAGSFNGWDPGQPTYALTNHMDGTYSITFTPSPGAHEFKFTRGSWDTVEGNAEGGFWPNRTLQYNGGIQQTALTIDGWEDISGMHTAEPNVTIYEEDFYIPQLDRTRRIWVYLPPDYQSSSKHYPVIYMQDGQNVFDVFYSFAGEWKVDESMNMLFDEGDFGAIVVAIDNGGGERINEYSPWANPSYGGGQGEAYAAFVAHTLKPHIDSTFRTLSGREYTAVAGSSLGANISMYTGIEYQDIIGKVGIFSPAFWFSDSAYIHLANKGIEHDLRVYFVAGENESETMISNMQQMHDALIASGQNPTEMYFLSESDGAHSEWFWAREYPDAYEWLFDEIILSENKPFEDTWTIYPNPVNESIYFKGTGRNAHTYSIYTSTGLIQHANRPFNERIDTTDLLTGVYFLQLKNKEGQVVFASRFFKL